MATLMYLTFKEGQKQTRISLAINQYNIFQKELDSFIKEANDIKFKSDLSPTILAPYKHAFENANGIYYIKVFDDVLDSIRLLPDDSTERRPLINDFRLNILTPLYRYYDKLYHFLIQINKDKVLTDQYKRILYNYIERDILLTYFRISNYKRGDTLYCDLSVFNTTGYPISNFYLINDFYIKNNAFQYKNLKFYANTF